MSINNADKKFLDYLSNEKNVQDYFNQSISDLLRRLKEADNLASVYRTSDNKRMFEAVLRSKHAMFSELALAELSKLNFLGNIRSQKQIKESLVAIVSDNKKDITDIVNKIEMIEKQSEELRYDKEFIDYLKRQYQDEARDLSLE